MSLLRAAATVSSLTLLSRITGLVRDVMIARAFGASALTDAFWVAFRIPNLLRRLFAEGAFAQAFVPILGQARNEHEAPAVKQLLAQKRTSTDISGSWQSVLSMNKTLAPIWCQRGWRWPTFAIRKSMFQQKRPQDPENTDFG